MILLWICYGLLKLHQQLSKLEWKYFTGEKWAPKPFKKWLLKCCDRVIDLMLFVYGIYEFIKKKEARFITWLYRFQRIKK